MSQAKDRIVKVALVQMSMRETVDQNLEQANQYIRHAADQGADVVCLPELFLCRYFCQSEDHDQFVLAESIPGPSSERLESIARELNIVIIASLFERRAAGIYHNTTIVLDGEKGYAGMYRKMHIPDDPRYYEKFYFTPGDLGFRSFQTQAGNIGVLICWDQWYPEAARLTALRGADIIFYPTAIGWHPEEKSEHGQMQHSAWETVQRGHAVANSCYVVSVNRTGFEPDPAGSGGIEFWGQSFVAGPSGDVICRFVSDEELVKFAELDLSRVEQTRVNWPFFRDRRIDAYGDISQRFIDS